MDYFYAQLDTNNTVVCVSQLSGEVNEPHMKLISTYDTSLLGSVYQEDGTFVKPIPPAPTLDDAKTAKLAELQTARDNALYSSFTSSALGTAKTYNYDREAYDNFRGETALLGIDTTSTTVDWATIEDGFISHTRDQFIQVIKDGAAHERALKMQYYQFVAQVNATTTIVDVEAIVW